MSVLDKARVIIYRFHEKGLEIFLIKPELANDPDVWKLPASSTSLFQKNGNNLIQLDPIKDKQGNELSTYAIEADWHEIPSIRGIIKHDIQRVTSKINGLLPCSEKGAYFVAKEAVRKVMPEEYAALKELKDILFDRNLATNI